MYPVKFLLANGLYQGVVVISYYIKCLQSKNHCFLLKIGKLIEKNEKKNAAEMVQMAPCFVVEFTLVDKYPLIPSLFNSRKKKLKM